MKTNKLPTNNFKQNPSTLNKMINGKGEMKISYKKKACQHLNAGAK